MAKDERLIGVFDFGPAVEAGSASATKIKDFNGAELFTFSPATRSVAAGVLLLTAIPPEHRYIIMAEMLARSL
ncbi:MAG: hypothetical protein EXS37_14060 [Opitutus sp.]|nr:hypothetical protein [Opitutus sp.]